MAKKIVQPLYIQISALGDIIGFYPGGNRRTVRYLQMPNMRSPVVDLSVDGCDLATFLKIVSPAEWTGDSRGPSLDTYLQRCGEVGACVRN